MIRIPVNPSEADISPQVVQAMTASGCQLWRNNRGTTKYGQRWVRYGVGPNGAADWIGFLPVRITPAMVGQYIAVFVSAETKRPKGAKYETDQFKWRDRVWAAGGIAGICHSWEQGRAMVSDFFARFKTQAKKPAYPQK